MSGNNVAVAKDIEAGSVMVVLAAALPIGALIFIPHFAGWVRA